MIKKPKIEWIVVAMAGIQFINIVEFMMIMPLGPDIANNLGIPLSDLARLSSVYTAAEAISSLIVAFLLNRFERRAIMVGLLIGSTVGTICSALATDFTSLLFGRAITGLFGGPLPSLTLAIVIDSVPFERRGYAIGYMSSSFSVASIIGIPIALQLAQYGGWQFPLLLMAITSTLLLGVVFKLPAHCCEDLHNNPPLTATYLLRSWMKPKALIIQIVSAISLVGAFLIIPNVSAYIQYNLNYSRGELSWLYLAGGATSFLMNQFAGYAVDRWGTSKIALIGTLLGLFSIYHGFVLFPIQLSFTLIFILYTAGNSMGAVARTNCVSLIPSTEERTGFMLLHGAVCCIGIAVGSFFSSLLLQTSINGQLVGMQQVAVIAMILSLVFPVAILWLKYKFLREGNKNSC